MKIVSCKKFKSLKALKVKSCASQLLRIQSTYQSTTVAWWIEYLPVQTTVIMHNIHSFWHQPNISFHYYKFWSTNPRVVCFILLLKSGGCVNSSCYIPQWILTCIRKCQTDILFTRISSVCLLSDYLIITGAELQIRKVTIRIKDWKWLKFLSISFLFTFHLHPIRCTSAVALLPEHIGSASKTEVSHNYWNGKCTVFKS